MWKALCVLSLLLPGVAQAFCGTYVGGAGAELTNGTSQVALTRVDNRTVLTMANDVNGDTSNFALVVPVPEVMGEDAIKVLDLNLFDRLNGYSEPRLVKYECKDFESKDYDTDTDTDTDSDTDTDTDVDVEAEYVVGEYEVVILSATESSALVEWLRSNNYDVPSTSEKLLGEYLDSGSYFFAAKVNEEEMVAPGQLRPLQFAYESETFGLPIRLGTLSSPGEQDLVLYTINPYSEGSVAIANYPEVTMEDECLFDTYRHDEFGSFYEMQVANAHAKEDDASWIREYAWQVGKCDPCTGAVINEQDLTNLGVENVYAPYFLTRNRMRYTPDQAKQDLVLYKSGKRNNEQLRYIQYAPYLEDRWPVCWEGWMTDPGSCDIADEDPDDKKEKACAAVTHPTVSLMLLLLVAGVARTRHRKRSY